MPRNSWLRWRLAGSFARGGQWGLGKLAAVLMLLIAAVSRVYGADEASTNAYMGMSFDELLEVKVDRVYGASRFEQDISEAPASVTIITSDEIERYGHRNLPEVLRSVRGLYATYDRNYSYLGVRGFSRPGDYNSRVLVLVDGHRMNDNIWEATLIEGFMDVDMVDRIEVIRGPSSSIYGSSAFFGVINIVTKTGHQFDSAEASVEAGSLDTYKLRASLGKKFTNDVELLVSASIYESQGQDRIHFPEFRGATNRFGIVRNADEERAGTCFATLSYRDFTLSGGAVAREKNVPTASFATVFGDGREETLDMRSYVDLKYDHTFEDDTRLMARAFYDANRYYGTYPMSYSPGTITLFRDQGIGDWAGTDWQLNRTVLDKHTLVIGFDYREDIRQDQFNYDERPRQIYLDDRRRSRNVGAYAQAEVTICSNLLASVGVRYDYYERFGDSVNPRAGLIYSPATNTTFKAIYGRAFRAPSAYELYYNPLTEDLNAETIDTYELVYEQKLPAHLQFTTSIYYYTVDELITVHVTPAGNPYYVNGAKADAMGIEFELGGHWQHVLGHVSYALQRAEDGKTNDELSNSPRHLAKLNLSVPVFTEKLLAGVELQFNGGVRTIAGGRADDFVVVNLTLLSRQIARNLDVSASIYNLFDTKYGYPGSEDHRQQVIEQDGRGFRVKLTYKF